MTSTKRKMDMEDNDFAGHKKRKLDNIQESPNKVTKADSGRIKKLVPPRPWYINPSNTTGPRSARDGRNYICVTRKTALGAYMRRCKELVLNDGYATIYLSAMGAAVPHLMQLACSLQDILPFPRNEIDVNVTTGTVEVQDEILPEDLEEDAIYQTRSKSTLTVVIKVGRGDMERVLKRQAVSEKQVVIGEPEQEDI